MELGDFIILIAFAVGYLIIFVYQKKKIGTLITQIDKQKDILEHTERFMNIFSVDKVEKYVKLSEKTIQMEKEEVIKKMGSELKKKESERRKGIDYVLKEHKALFGVVIDLIGRIPYLSVIENLLKEMKDTETKQFLEAHLENVRVNLKSQGVDREQWLRNYMWGTFMTRALEEEKSQMEEIGGEE